MTFRSSFLLASRYLFSPRAAREKGERTVRHLRGAVLGIGFSLVPLIVVLVVSDGMISGITSRFIELGTYHVQAFAYGERSLAGLERLSAEVSRCPGVRYASPEMQGLGLAVSGSGRSGATIRAVAPDQWDRDEGFRRYLRFTSGAWRLDRPGDILLGENLARSLAVRVGDTVRLMTVRSTASGGFVPRLGSFTVRGIFSSGYRELDALWAFVSLATGERLLPLGSGTAFIGIKTDRPFGNLQKTVQAVTGVMPARSAVYSWYELEESQYRSYQTTKELLIFIMALIVLVAAINVSSSLIMLVLEKRRDIAVLKSVGASPGGITAVFLACGLLTGILGAALGTAAGIFAAININEIIVFLERVANAAWRAAAFLVSPAVTLPATTIRILDPAYYLEVIPVSLDPLELFVVAGCTVLLSLACSWVPARQASRMKPLDILRKF